MSRSKYASLHAHADYSLLDGHAKPQEYVQVAAEMGHTALGLTDHGTLSGIYSFVNLSRKAGLTPVPGCEFYVAPVNPEGAKVSGPVFYGPGGKQAKNDVAAKGAYLHLTVWAYNNEGLHNLFRLSTLSYHPEHVFRKPRIDFDMLARYSDGLIVSTGCPSSEISTRFSLGQDDKAYEYASQLKEVFQGRLFMEVMDHSMSIDLERNLIPKQLEMSRRLGLPLLATNDCHYARKADALAHEEMLCMQSGSRMSDRPYDEGGTRFSFNGDQYYLKPSQEMEALFPEDRFPGALSNSLLIAEMASDISLSFDPHLKPFLTVPEEFGGDQLAYYKHLLREGLIRRYKDAPPQVRNEALRRSTEELEVIHSSDFIGYMLVVRDYLSWTKEMFSTVDGLGNVLALPIGVGRGSVGGSIHAFALGISEIDPIRHDLLLERFLSPGRGAVHLVTYDDGTSEELVVSDRKKVMVEGEPRTRYTHQLEVGDVIIEEGE